MVGDERLPAGIFNLVTLAPSYSHSILPRPKLGVLYNQCVSVPLTRYRWDECLASSIPIRVTKSYTVASRPLLSLWHFVDHCISSYSTWHIPQ